MKQKILVTGGAGFIGSNIVDSYINLGHEVWVIDNESSGKKININKKARYRKIDITQERYLKALMSRVRFDTINHHAAQIDVRASVRNPIHDAKVNVLGLLNILNLAVLTNVKKIIFSASGGTAYGECTRPAVEGMPEQPLSPYGVTKLAGEKYIQTFHALHGISFTIFRYANVYGPRQDPHGEAGVVAIFSEKILKNENVFIYGSGNQARDFVFVKDVAHANVLALNRGNNQIINIGTGQETSVNKLFQVMADLSRFTGKAIKKPKRPGELQRSVLNIRKASQVLGWKPQYTLREGLGQTLTYFHEKLKL